MKMSGTVFGMGISQRTINLLIFCRKTFETGLDKFIPVKIPIATSNCGMWRHGDDDERSFGHNEIPHFDVPRCKHPQARVGRGQNLVGVFVWGWHGLWEIGYGKDGL